MQRGMNRAREGYIVNTTRGLRETGRDSKFVFGTLLWQAPFPTEGFEAQHRRPEQSGDWVEKAGPFDSTKRHSVIKKKDTWELKEVELGTSKGSESYPWSAL
jgi:hypothetical protein